LGRIGDGLLALLRHLPADADLSPDEKDSICDLKTMLREIATAKRQQQTAVPG
jgi:hypothetical protein